MTTLQSQLANAIIDYIAGSDTVSVITSIITEEQWNTLNAQYRFSSDSYDQDNDEHAIVATEFPNL